MCFFKPMDMKKIKIKHISLKYIHTHILFKLVIIFGFTNLQPSLWNAFIKLKRGMCYMFNMSDI